MPPTTSLATGVAEFTLNDAETELTYRIELDGVALKTDPADRTEPGDVTRVHFHAGARGTNGPHVLNVFGTPSEDDDDLVVDYDNGIITGVWDDGDVVAAAPFGPGDTKPLSDFVDDLRAGRLYVQVHTVAHPDPGEIRGQIEQEAQVIHLSGVGSSERDFDRPGQVLVGPATVTINGEEVSMLSIATVLESRVLPDNTIFGRVTHTFEFGDGSTLTTLDHSRLVPTGIPGVSEFRPSRVITGGTGIFEGANGRLGTIPGEENFINLFNQSATWSLRGAIHVPPSSAPPGANSNGPPDPGSSFPVTNTLDAGAGSLRQAILDANDNPGLDTITFDVNGNGIETIALSSPLPVIVDPVVIDGAGGPNTPGIALDGSSAGPAADGLYITAGYSTVRGLVIGGFAGNGVVLDTGGNNVLEDNYIGLDPTGAAAWPNGEDGVLVLNSPDNRIGGTTPQARNVISGNLWAGIELVGESATGNQIMGNYVGLDAGGTFDLGNAYDGIAIANAPGNVVGGLDPRARNIISGNDGSGVAIIGSGAQGNLVQGNAIGTDALAAAPVGNSLDGVAVIDAPENTVGGTAFGDFGQNLARNVISGNTAYGVTILGEAATGNTVQGNYIGSDELGMQDLGNGFDGLLVDRAPGNAVGGTDVNLFGQNVARNVISGNDVFGITILGEAAAGNVVEGNYIGTDVSGIGALGNRFDGVVINSAPGNRIGGTTQGQFGNNLSQNVISGNGNDGIAVFDSRAAGNTIQGNLIGTDFDAMSDLGNARYGIFLSDAPGNQIGGTTFAAANVISGNDDVGVYILGSDAGGNVLEGNFIGTDAFGASAIGNTGNGVFIDRAFGNTIGGAGFGSRNVISGNLRNGVELVNGSANNTIQGNYVGVDVTGSTGLGNATDGVVLAASSNNTVGGPQPGMGNIISGNGGNGVIVSFGATDNDFHGNLIGTGVSGTSDIGNVGNGILVANAGGNNIGGPQFGTGNIVSGNESNGILVFGTFATENSIQGNLIGTDATATADLGNSGQGIMLNNAPGNTIGGTAFPAGNTISGNDANGILLFGGATAGNLLQGNLIGTQGDGFTPLGNTSHGVLVSAGASGNVIGTEGWGNTVAHNGGSGVAVDFGSSENSVRANSLDRNGGLGIDLGIDGVTTNDPGDSDGWQNFPVLAELEADAGGGTAIIDGELDSTPDTTFTIDLFASPESDPSGSGEGRDYLGSTNVTTDQFGQGSFVAEVPLPAEGHHVSATATNPNGGTSEFSANLIVGEHGDGNGGGNGGGDDALLRVEARVTGSPFGQSVTAWGGGRFWVSLYVEDLRPDGEGVVGGAIDVPFDTAALDPTGNVEYATDFSLFQQGAADNQAGQIDEAGALASTAGVGAGGLAPFIAWEFRVDPEEGARALAFTPNQGEGTSSISPAEFALVGLGSPVPWAEVEFVTAELDLLPGDFNADGLRNQFDLALFLSKMFIQPEDPRYDPQFDLSGDGPVNQFDLAVLIPLLFNDGANGPDPLVVINSQDAGEGSLRHALLEANNNPGEDPIHFAIPGFGAHTIVLESPLPAVTDPVTVDATTQPGYRGMPLIEIDGSQAGADADGLVVTAGDSTVRGLVVNHFSGRGIVLQSSGGNTIEGNFVGTDLAGASDRGNGMQGILVDGTSSNTIGGIEPEQRNVISGNGLAGVEILGSGATGNTIEGNLIGTDAQGTGEMGNDGDGVSVEGASENTIGGTELGSANVVAYNGNRGVSVRGSAAGNSVLGNSIHSNAALGVDLGLDGPTTNDPNDSDEGPNHLQNFPVLASAETFAGFITVTGEFAGEPESTYRLEFFASPAPDPSGFGEGQVSLGIQTVTTDEEGHAEFYSTFPPMAPVGFFVTATATGPDGSSTSEFSPPILIEEAPQPDVGLRAFFVPTPISQPTTVITGPDGNVYFTEQFGNQIGRLNMDLIDDPDPSNDISEFPIPTELPPLPFNPTGSTRPIAQAFDDNGRLWFAELFGNAIGRFDPTSETITEFALPDPNSQPGGMTLGPDGNIWFNENASNRIGTFDPDTFDPADTAAGLTYFEIPTMIPPTAPPPNGDNPTGSSQPRFIRPGPDGNIWFTEFGANKIGRINLDLLDDGDPNNDVTEIDVPFDPDVPVESDAVLVGKPGVPTSNVLGSSQPRGLAPGPDGNMWFTEFAANKIGRVNLDLLDDGDPTNDVSEFEVPTPDSVPFGIITGPDGNLWFTEHAVGKIGIINPEGEFLAEIRLPTIIGPSDIQPGPNGELVVAAGAGNVILVLENPDINAPQAEGPPVPILPPTERTGITVYSSGFTGHVGGLTFDPTEEYLYFSEQFDNRIGRFDVETQVVEEWTVPPGLLPHSAKIGPNLGGPPNPEGAIWWSGLGSGFAVFDLATEEIAIIGFGGGPGQLTPGTELHDYVFAPDGDMYFTEQGASMLGRLNLDRADPNYLNFEEFPIEFAPGVDTSFIEDGGDHEGEEEGEEDDQRLRPHNIIIAPPDIFGPNKFFVALEHVDALAVWDSQTQLVTQLFDVDVDGGVPDRAPHDMEPGPGPDGRTYLYYTQLTGHRLGRLDMETGEVVEFSTLAPPAEPGSSSDFVMEVLPNSPSMFHLIHHEQTNSIWFALQQQARVGRLDIATGEVIEYSLGIPPGRGPLVLREGPDGDIWVSTVSLVPPMPGGLIRIDPERADAALHPILVAAEPGEEPRVRVRDHTGREWLDFLAFEPDFLDGFRASLADVTADRTPEIIASTFDFPPDVRIFDLATGMSFGGPEAMALGADKLVEPLVDAALAELTDEGP